MQGTAMRMRGLMRKEMIQVLRDPSAILIAFLLPVVLLLVNGYGLSLDASHMRVAVVLEAPEETARGLMQAMAASPYLSVQRVLSMPEARADMAAGRVRGILVVREDFAAVARGGTLSPGTMALSVNATDPNSARLLEGYVTGAITVWQLGQAHELRRLLTGGGIDLQVRDWFNPELRSQAFIVPGIVVMVMTMTGTLLTALIVAREWERGTMEAMLASPARMSELIGAKLACYFALGITSMAMAVSLSIVLFGVPFRGSVLALGAASALFLVSALGLGLFISTLARNQFVASQLAFLTTMMPALMLSGMLFDIAAMPRWLQLVTYITPARYLVSILQTLFLAGDVWPVLLPNLGALAIAAACAVGATLAVTRRRLD